MADIDPPRRMAPPERRHGDNFRKVRRRFYRRNTTRFQGHDGIFLQRVVARQMLGTADPP
jgi:hypothetical protein